MRMVLNSRLLRLPVATRYRLPPGAEEDEEFLVGNHHVQHWLTGNTGWVLVDGVPIAVDRGPSRWGDGTGSWLLRCQGCGNGGRVLHGEMPWLCRRCAGLRRPRRRERHEAAVDAAPARRPGEPYWRWRERRERAVRLAGKIEA